MDPDRFYLGAHEPGWLGKATFRLCVARQRLWRNSRTVPRAVVPWMLDSGAYMALDRLGHFPFTAEQYVKFIRRCQDEIGMLDWAAPMDHMCEPHIRRKTGLTTATHQNLTVDNYLELRWLDDTLPIHPVLQGWEPWEYDACADLYERRGISLAACELVGLGGVCRLQDTSKAGAVLDVLEHRGLALHGFGFKMTGLARHGHRFAAADSMAWSYNARRNPPLPGCTHDHCQNCYRRAAWWRARLLTKMEDGKP